MPTIGVPQSEPGVVTQASPLLVQLDTSATPVPAYHLTSYTPTLGDRVSTLPQGTMLLCLGRFL